MDDRIQHGNCAYVLMTAAHNEEANIEKTLQSVVKQTILPKRWVIVSDNSTDRTDEIVRRFSNEYRFIEFVRLDRPPGRNFAAKILALREGFKRLHDLEYAFIGNLDADIELEPGYFEDLLRRMTASPSLGIAAGYVCEELNGRFQSRAHNRVYSVAHAAQLVRRECYDGIGGYAILKFGGEDTHAATSAKMRGWQAQSFPELKIYHQRHTGGGGSQLQSAFRQGRMEYHLGYDVLFEFMKCIGRMKERPFLVAGIARMVGFSWSYVKFERRSVSREFMAFVRKEQRQRLTSFLFVRRTERQV